MDEQKKSLVDRINQAQNILVTVSANPSVDQLAAAIGLTVALNKLNKHGTAVFSGQVPSTIEFLKPEETLEKTTDSLRDFIIALDKSKADKLRYKVDNDAGVVRIFITPYRVSITDKDLEFSQGDFNVDVVIALGVAEQADLDVAITAHGRILHDASVASISTQGQGTLGTVNWVDPGASCLSEMMVALIDGLDKKLIDGQIATALLTGIVATTERFSNDKTTPRTMSASAELMAAGANQQLIASELEAPVVPPAPSTTEPAETATVPAPQNSDAAVVTSAAKVEPGTLEIAHEAPVILDEPEEPVEPEHPQVFVNEDGEFSTLGTSELPQISGVRGTDTNGQATESKESPVSRVRLDEPPQFNDAALTANSSPEALDPASDELTQPATNSPILTHNGSSLPPASTPAALPPLPPIDAPNIANPFSATAMQPAPADWQPPVPPTLPELDIPETTLAELEQSVDSPHVQDDVPAVAPVELASSLDDARAAVEAAMSGAGAPAPTPAPIAALNAQPLGPELRDQPAQFAAAPTPIITNTGFNEPTPGNSPADRTLDMPLPSNPFGPPQQFTPPPVSQPTFAPISAFPGSPQGAMATPSGQAPPPPVPPPMLPPLQ